MKVMKLVLLKEGQNLIGINFVIEVPHKDNLFLCAESGRDELTDVLEEELPRAFLIVGGEKISVLLGIF